MGTTISVMVADDHRILREGLRRMIGEQPDMRVVAEAASGVEAVELAESKRPEVVTMDIALPDVDGITAARRIVARRPGIGIVMLSMHSDRRYVVEALRAGARGYLLKDCEPGELVASIRAVRSGTSFIGRGVTDVVVDGIIRDGVRPPASVLACLTERELEVLRLMVAGESAKQIAARFDVGVKTIETHQYRLRDKLGIHNLVELVKLGIREGLTTAQPAVRDASDR